MALITIYNLAKEEFDLKFSFMASVESPSHF